MSKYESIYSLNDAPATLKQTHSDLAQRHDLQLDIITSPPEPDALAKACALKPLVAVIGPHIDQTLICARQVYQLLPAIHIIFLVENHRQDLLKRELRFAAMVGTHWNICSPDDPALQRLITDAARSTRQRRQLRTQIEQVNQKLASHSPVGTEELNQLIISDQLLASILTNATDAILSTDLHGKVLTWNRAAERLFGYQEKEILGKSLTVLNADNEKNVIANFLQQTMLKATDIRSEMVCARKNGETIDIDMTLTLIRDELNKPFGLSVIARDISERKLSERRLRESEQQLREMSDAIPQQVWTARPDGQLDYVNDYTLKYIEDITIEDGIVQWAHVIHPDDLPNSIAAWTHSVGTGEPYDVEQRIFHRKKQCVPLESHPR